MHYNVHIELSLVLFHIFMIEESKCRNTLNYKWYNVSSNLVHSYRYWLRLSRLDIITRGRKLHVNTTKLLVIIINRYIITLNKLRGGLRIRCPPRGSRRGTFLRRTLSEGTRQLYTSTQLSMGGLTPRGKNDFTAEKHIVHQKTGIKIKGWSLIIKGQRQQGWNKTKPLKNIFQHSRTTPSF